MKEKIMDVDQMGKEVLKSLCLQYQTDLSVETFGQILIRVDKLVNYLVWKCIKQLPHLRRVEAQDVYNTCIVGLYAGVKKIKEDDIPDVVIAKFIAYMRCEVRKAFPQRPDLPTDWIDEMVFDDDVETSLEFDIIDEKINMLVSEGICDKFEISIMKAHFMWEIPYSQLADMYDWHVDALRILSQNCLTRIKHQFRIRGIEG